VLTARSEFWVALAGPLTSLALGLCFYLLTLIFSGFTPLELLAKYLAFINITLALFNLVPGFPLDGGRVFRAIWWGISHNFQQATSVSVAIGQLVALGFILYGIWQVATGSLGNGVWFIFLGWFLDSAANRQRQQQSLRELLGERQVSEAATRSYVIIPCCITLQKLADDHILGTGRRFYIVEDEQENICGIVTLHDVSQVPRDHWATTNVEQIMVPLEKMRQVHPENSLWDSLEHMDQEGVNQLPVMMDGKLVGVLSRDGIISFLKRQQLQK
jgi:CBS domain-containing protein